VGSTSVEQVKSFGRPAKAGPTKSWKAVNGQYQAEISHEQFALLTVITAITALTDITFL
jgi:hypothetical protein